MSIKRERKVGRHGGSSKWPVHTLLLIYELLVNATPPSVVAAKIQTMSAKMNGSKVNELPCINLCGNVVLLFRI